MRTRLLALRASAAVVLGCFLAYYGLYCFRHEWASDFQMYCSGVAQLHRDFADPGHEALNVPGSQSTVYTLYLVLVAALGKLLALTPYRALQLAGVLNLCAYVAAVYYLFSRCSIHRHAVLPAACFVLVSLCVRSNHFGWSGENSAVMMAYLQAYPSTLAWALAFTSFALVEDIRTTRKARPVVLLGAALCALLLTHAITASWVVGIAGLRALYTGVRARDWRPVVLVGAAVAAAFALAALWPYSSFFHQSSLTGTREPGARFGKQPFADFWSLYLIALPCAAWLAVRVRRHLFWVLAFAATFAALLLWRWLEVHYGNRYSFFMAFCAQLLVAEVVAAGLAGLLAPLPDSVSDSAAARLGVWDRAVAVAVLLAAVVAAVWSPMWRLASKTGAKPPRSPIALLEQSSPHDAYYRRYAPLMPHLGPEDLVLTPVSRDVFDLVGITGAPVISAPQAHAVPDQLARRREVDRFFNKGTSAAVRRNIVRHHGATKVLVPARHDVIPALTKLFGEPIFRDRAFVLFAVPAAPDRTGPADPASDADR